MVEGLSIASPRAADRGGGGAATIRALVLRVLDPPSAADLSDIAEFERDTPFGSTCSPAVPRPLRPLDVAQAAARLPIAGPAALPSSFEPTDFVQVNGHAEPGDDRSRARRCWRRSRRTRCSTSSAASATFRCRSRAAAGRVVRCRRRRERLVAAGAAPMPRRNGIDNVEFHRGRPFQGDVAGVAWARDRYDRRAARPAAGRCAEILPTVARSGARASCIFRVIPAVSLAMPGCWSEEHGFRLSAAGVMDMFPHTATSRRWRSSSDEAPATSVHAGR